MIVLADPADFNFNQPTLQIRNCRVVLEAVDSEPAIQVCVDVDR